MSEQVLQSCREIYVLKCKPPVIMEGNLYLPCPYLWKSSDSPNSACETQVITVSTCIEYPVHTASQTCLENS